MDNGKDRVPNRADVPSFFGEMVFGDEVMKTKLPRDIYRSLRQTIDEGSELDITVANVVAAAMKDWAVEKGATHYTHWFQPMNGITAEKHDSFLSPQENGGVIMEFSGKELIKGEPDASSFPSGGLRSTFEARGYTAWDPTSYAFIKDDSLCIPTVFCSYGGEVLDKKTPLLRSMEALNTHTLRILRLFGDHKTTRVSATVGAEQEYFLIDHALYERRKDLILTGRTLFGARPPKGQELEDHYFGAIRPRVMAFMKELNEELWKLGVYAKTEHNEAAPSQHELAPVFVTSNIATDQNQLTMEIMKKVADRHGLACLLHEKPFEGVNGSGKHNNWSLTTTDGVNLFKPGKTPHNNRLFLLLLCAVITAVDLHQDLLRIAVAGAGNDHRLGGNEAPPAIVSMFLGDELEAILDSIENGTHYDPHVASRMVTGVQTLPNFNKDTTDRNRTSPFAFTGNKFEFRMLGSSASIAEANIVLNTIMADVLADFADELEAANGSNEAIDALMKRVIHEHKRIIFNGNNYTHEWVEEAERRGLLNLRTTADAIPYYASEKNIRLFGRHNIFNGSEIQSRSEILEENYRKVINIEALTMLEMARREILPAVYAYEKTISENAVAMAAVGIPIVDRATMNTLNQLTILHNQLYDRAESLEETLRSAVAAKSTEDFRDKVLPAMAALREPADALEMIVGRSYWPFPTYDEMLFSV